MILVDASVWIDHLRKSDPVLSGLLEKGNVFSHPWVRGELALGNIKDRMTFMKLLSILPALDTVPAENQLEFIENRKLFGKGLGWVDVQLLASCLFWPCRLWTKDKKLAEAAAELGISWQPHENQPF